MTILREYETITILRPEIPDESVDRVKGRIAGIVEKLSGKVIRIDNWGKRKLAYEVDKNSKGIYLYFLYLGVPGVVEEIERNCKMWDDVVRFLTVKVDDDVDPEVRPAEISEDELRAAAEAAAKPPPEALPPDHSQFAEVMSTDEDEEGGAVVAAAAVAVVAAADDGEAAASGEKVEEDEAADDAVEDGAEEADKNDAEEED